MNKTKIIITISLSSISGDVIEFVKNNPEAIGYVSLSANTAGLKTLTIN
jgi:hypothetical protein